MTLILSGTSGLSDVDGSAATPAIRGTDANTGIFFGADIIGFAEGGAEVARFDSAGNLLVGTANTPSNRDTVTPKLVVNGAGVAGSMQVVRNTTVGGGGALLELTATRGSDVNSYTILQSGDGVGSIVFGGADGTQFTPAATILAQVDGTPGANDMPGRLIFSTTSDGAATVTERMRLDSSGNLQFNSGYGSVATAYACRAWVNFNGTGTVAIRGSGNVTSITDNGTGDYTVNFTTAMPDANYAVSLTSGGTTARSTANSPGGAGTFATTSCQVVGFIDSTSLFTDQAYMSVAIFR
jgi:hypothetical protein